MVPGGTNLCSCRRFFILANAVKRCLCVCMSNTFSPAPSLAYTPSPRPTDHTTNRHHSSSRIASAARSGSRPSFRVSVGTIAVIHASLPHTGMSSRSGVKRPWKQPLPPLLPSETHPRSSLARRSHLHIDWRPVLCRRGRYL